MATVYKAWDATHQRYVALKVLPPHFQYDTESPKRFRQEAQAVAKLDHPNSNSYANSNVNQHAHTYSHANSNADQHAHGYPHAHVNGHRHANNRLPRLFAPYHKELPVSRA